MREFCELFANCPVPLAHPVHPRTLEKLQSKNVFLLAPNGYYDFIKLLSHCAFVPTDSGGIQEEVTAPNIRRKAFVLRHSTEGPQALESGFADLVGTNTCAVLGRLRQFMNERWSSLPNPFGEGCTSRKIVDAITDDQFRTNTAEQEVDQVTPSSPQ